MCVQRERAGRSPREKKEHTSCDKGKGKGPTYCTAVLLCIYVRKKRVFILEDSDRMVRDIEDENDEE